MRDWYIGVIGVAAVIGLLVYANYSVQQTATEPSQISAQQPAGQQNQPNGAAAPQSPGQQPPAAQSGSQTAPNSSAQGSPSQPSQSNTTSQSKATSTPKQPAGESTTGSGAASPAAPSQAPNTK